MSLYTKFDQALPNVSNKVKTKIDVVFVSKKKLTVFFTYLLRSSQMNIVIYDVIH